MRIIHYVLFVMLMLVSVSVNAELQISQSTQKTTVKVSGELISSDSIKYSPPKVPYLWNLTIKHMAEDGKPIMPGMPVIAFEDRRLRERLAEKQSQLETAKKQRQQKQLESEQKLEQLKLDIAEAKMNLEKAQRKTELNDPTLASKDMQKYQLELELAQVSYQIKQELLELHLKSISSSELMEQRKIDRLKLEVDELNSSIDKLQIKADREGFVLHLSDWNNNKFSNGQSVSVMQKVIEVADLSKMQVKAVIDEPLAQQVSVGQEVNVRLDAYPERIFKGEIIELSDVFRTFTREQPKVVFDAIIELKDVDSDVMRPGMNARVAIQVNDERQGIFIPENYIVKESGQVFTLVKSLFGTDKRSLVLGDKFQDMIEVVSGLKEGEVLVKP